MSSAEASTGIWEGEVSEEGNCRGAGVDLLEDTRTTHEPETGQESAGCGRQGPGWRETWAAWHTGGI